MDPDENLKQQLLLAKKMVSGSYTWTDADQLAELVTSLNEWIQRGGFLPKEWQKKAPPAHTS